MRMTVIACQRVIAVTTYFIVFIVCFCLLVTTQTVESVLVACCMTKFAGDIMLACARERVLEGCGFPCSGSVTMLAVMGKVRSQMVRRLLIVRCVT